MRQSVSSTKEYLSHNKCSINIVEILQHSHLTQKEKVETIFLFIKSLRYKN